MYGILLSAINVALRWLFRTVIIKFVLLSALYLVTSTLMSHLTSLIPSSSNVNGALGSIGAGTWYFLNLFEVTHGLSLVITAYGARFILRRVPVVG